MSDDRTKPSFSTRLWSEEVGMADPSANFNAPPVLEYRLGNRTLFSDINTTLYGNLPPPELTVSAATRQGQLAQAVLLAFSEPVDGVAASSQAQASRAQTAASFPVAFDVTGFQGQRSAGQLVAATPGVAADTAVQTRQGQHGAANAGINAGIQLTVSATTRQGQKAVSTAKVNTVIDNGPPQTGTAIATGSQIAPLTVENTSSTAVANLPFTIGHAFAVGHLPAAGANVSLHLADGTAIPAQLNVRATHRDGSVRHAVISAIVPSIPANGSLPLSLRRASAGPASAAVGLPASLPSASLNIAGVTYTASPTAATPYTTWFAGPLASDYIFNMPFVDAAGVEHPTLTAQFSVRAYSTGHVRVDYVIEHCKAFVSFSDITYDAALIAQGKTVYTRTALVHTPAARWKRSIWYGPTPTLHIRHDTNYLIDSKQVPNYDRSVVVPETVLANYATQLASTIFDPMNFGRLVPAMYTTGGRPDIGLMPDTHATAVLTMDRRAKAIVLATGDIGGSWPGCLRDVSAGPGRGMPISVINFPYLGSNAPKGDCYNPVTKQYERLPDLVTATKGRWDTAHQPDVFYLPYLLTGDLYYLEGLQFWATACHYDANPWYRSFDRGLVGSDQGRGQAWTMRSLAECLAITPDDHPLKPHFQYWIDQNVMYFNGRYTDGNNNVLGIITSGYTVVYSCGGATSNGIGPWQDDFFTQSMGHCYELLGFEPLRRLLYWKAKFQIDRMLDPAVCINLSCNYSLAVRSSATAPFFTSLAECYDFQLSATFKAAACNSPQMLSLLSSKCLPGDIDGYPDSTEGMPADYQPALAAAVDVGYPGGAQAWAKFQARPTKPPYGTGPQFAIVPRTL